MLLPRIIPCLLVKNRGLVKTINFTNPKYVGDPINAVRIFNEKEADEIIVLDIDASAKNIEPDYKMIENIAAECRMPFCYGGGFKTVKQAKRIFSLGVEKIALSSIALETPEIIGELSSQVGSQSVVVVLDVKKNTSQNYDIYTCNATKKHDVNIFNYIERIQSLGVGEIVINSIDNDGVMRGYDLGLIKELKSVIEVPLTVLGGAGSLEDFRALIQSFGSIGVAAGSLFVFKGRFRAVLINYPNSEEKSALAV